MTDYRPIDPRRDAVDPPREPDCEERPLHPYSRSVIEWACGRKALREIQQRRRDERRETEE